MRATVYIECQSMYRTDGVPEFRSVGEMEFVNGVAAMSASGSYGPARACAGIVGFADLRLGARVDDVLERLLEAGGGRFRGVRHSAVWHAPDAAITTPINPKPPKGLLLDQTFREGFSRLGPRGLTFDAWLYFTQLADLTDLARAFPGTTIIANHLGGILGVGVYAGKRDEVFTEWRKEIAQLATCPNVQMKLGGLGMPRVGFGFRQQEMPPSSQEIATAALPYFETCIDHFGVDRCMFESNFPVDKESYGYAILWNAFKRLAAGYSAAEKQALFSGTASSVYRLFVGP